MGAGTRAQDPASSRAGSSTRGKTQPHLKGSAKYRKRSGANGTIADLPNKAVLIALQSIDKKSALEAKYRTALVISPEPPLTNALIAQAIGVSRSQPTRWFAEQETPSPQSQARLADLYNVAAQFQMVWPASLLAQWLASANAHLAGRKPVDVFRLEGGAPLLSAIRADGGGAYA